MMIMIMIFQEWLQIFPSLTANNDIDTRDTWVLSLCHFYNSDGDDSGADDYDNLYLSELWDFISNKVFVITDLIGGYLQ